MTLTPNTPEPAKWAVEAAVAALPMEGGEDSQRRSRILNERAELAAIIQRRADSAMEEMRKERDDYRNAFKLMEHKVIACGVAATHPDIGLLSRPPYSSKWASKQMEQVLALRAQLAAAEAKVEELEKDRERLAFIRTNCEVTYNGRLIEDIAELDAARTPKETSQ